MRYKLTLAYQGTSYAGWQLQSASVSQQTIQGAVETALFSLTGQTIRVHGAGRTDAGVHALGQVAHCNLPAGMRDWRHQLNALLPPDIRVLAAEPVADAFHARYSASCKTYIYRFWQEKAFILPQIRNYVWACGPLDVARIAHGLEKLVGMHDFASFQNAGSSPKSTERTILGVRFGIEPIPLFTPDCLPLLGFTITGTGFLKQMVRNIAGFLADIGKGKAAWDDLEKILAARSRSVLKSPTAPAAGLCLARIEYDT